MKFLRTTFEPINKKRFKIFIIFDGGTKQLSLFKFERWAEDLSIFFLQLLTVNHKNINKRFENCYIFV
jgi:hypothetical protein